MTTQVSYNPVFVACWQILARRGRAIRQAQEAADCPSVSEAQGQPAAGAALPDGTGRNTDFTPADGDGNRG